MTETITSKFKTAFWFQIGIMITVISGFIVYCVRCSLRNGEINIYSGELLVGIVVSGLFIYLLNNLLRIDISVITLTPQHMVIDYSVTKKQEIIEYSEISGLSTVRGRYDKSWSMASRKYYESLEVELTSNRTIFIRENMYRNYNELKDTLYSITKHPRD